MNIVQALDAAIPELPERIIRRDKPRMDSRVITKEHIENGRPIIVTKLPGTEVVLRFIPEQWKLIQLFDGNRTYKEIAELSAEATGSAAGRKRKAIGLTDGTESQRRTGDLGWSSAVDDHRE